MRFAKTLTFGLMIGGAAVAQADVLVNTFGSSGNGYFANAGWNISSSIYMGKTFSVSGAYTLSQIEMALRIDGETDQMNVTLRPDIGGQPGAALETFTVGPDFGAGVAGVFVLNSTLNPLLTTGTYYVTVDPIGDALGKWNFSNIGGSGTLVVSNDGGSAWTHFVDVQGAVRVHGTQAVPEPATLAVLGLGAAALIRRRRSR